MDIFERINLPELAKLTAGTAVVNPAIPAPSDKDKGVGSIKPAEAENDKWTSDTYRCSLSLPGKDWRFDTPSSPPGTAMHILARKADGTKTATLTVVESPALKTMSQPLETGIEKGFLQLTGSQKVSSREQTVDGRTAYRLVTAFAVAGEKTQLVLVTAVWHGRTYAVSGSSAVSDVDTDPEINACINSFHFLDPPDAAN